METRHGHSGYSRTLFHTTSADSAKKILHSGFFKPGTEGYAGGGIYFADSLEASKWKAENKGVTLKAIVYVGVSAVIDGKKGFNEAELQKRQCDSVMITSLRGHEYVVFRASQITDIQLCEGLVNFAYNWVHWKGSVPQNAVKASQHYVAIRAYHNGTLVQGKLRVPELKAYISYGGKEIRVTGNIEVLTHVPGAQVSWVKASQGKVPKDAVVSLGDDQTIVGRAVCPQPENIYTPGKVHPSHKCLYLPWGGKEYRYEHYEVCSIKPPTFTYKWVPYQGTLPQNFVEASSNYVVIRALHNGEIVPGKFCVSNGQAYIPYGTKELHVSSNIEVLVHAPGAQVTWKSVSDGHVPKGAVGPCGKEKTFIGRVVSPQPESKYTPGKIHQSHKCLYLPWYGKELRYTSYEACVIYFP